MHATQPSLLAESSWNELVDRHHRFDLHATTALLERLTLTLSGQSWFRPPGSRRRFPVTEDLRQSLTSLLWIELRADDRLPSDRSFGSGSGWINWELLRSLDHAPLRRLDAWATARLARLAQWQNRQGEPTLDTPELPETVHLQPSPLVGEYTLRAARTQAGGTPRGLRLFPRARRDDPALDALIDILVLFNGFRDRWRAALITQCPSPEALTRSLDARPELQAERQTLRSALESLVRWAATHEQSPRVDPARIQPRVAAWMAWHALDLVADTRRGVRRDAADLLVQCGFSPRIYNSMTTHLAAIDPLAEAALARVGAPP
jgi:hypothetical protein